MNDHPLDRAALRALLEALPPGSAMSLPREWVQRILDCGEVANEPASVARLAEVDLTLEEVGAVLQRSPITIRAYCNAGLFPVRTGCGGGGGASPAQPWSTFQESNGRLADRRPRRRNAA